MTSTTSTSDKNQSFFSRNTYVKVQSLKSKPELNFKIGRVERYIPDRDRYLISFAPQIHDAPISLKAINICEATLTDRLALGAVTDEILGRVISTFVKEGAHARDVIRRIYLFFNGRFFANRHGHDHGGVAPTISIWSLPVLLLLLLGYSHMNVGFGDWHFFHEYMGVFVVAVIVICILPLLYLIGIPSSIAEMFGMPSGTSTTKSGARARKKRQRKQKAVAATLTASTLLGAWFLSPISNIIVSYLLLTVPIRDDIKLGRESWYGLRARYPIVMDRWSVSDIGNDLVRRTLSRTASAASSSSRSGGGKTTKHHDDFCSRSAALLDIHECRRQLREYTWSFEVVSSSEINAFALPGGIIRVTDSLLNTLQPTRGEIAALLGHEMGHVLHRHSQAKLLKKNIWNYIITEIFNIDGNGKAKKEKDRSLGHAMGDLMLKGATFLGEMRFSRQDEYQADAAAFDLLTDSGIYHPGSVQSLLSKLWSLSGSGNGGTSWDKTHPGSAERIEALASKWDSMSIDEKRKYHRFSI